MKIFMILIVISMAGLVMAYTAQDFDSVDLVLDLGYTAQDFDSVDLVIGELTDTCTYNSGDWEINCSDNCTITSDFNIAGNNMIFTGSGTFFISSDIVNYNNLILSSGCLIIFDSGASLSN